MLSSSVHFNGHSLELAFLWCCLLCVQGGSNICALSEILKCDHSNEKLMIAKELYNIAMVFLFAFLVVDFWNQIPFP